MYGYDLEMWITGIFCSILRLPFDFAYRLTVFLTHFFLLSIPLLCLRKTKVTRTHLLMFSVLFCFPPFIKSAAFGMHAYLLGWTIFSWLIFSLYFVETPLSLRRASLCGGLLGLLPYAHPFAAAVGFITVGWKWVLSKNEKEKIFFAILIALLIASPRVYAAILGHGWLTSDISPLPDIAEGWDLVWHNFILVLLTGNNIRLVASPYLWASFFIRSLPFVVLIVWIFRSKMIWNREGIILLLPLSLSVWVLLREPGVYLGSERFLAFTYPFLFFTFTKSRLEIPRWLAWSLLLPVTMTIVSIYRAGYFRSELEVSRHIDALQILCDRNFSVKPPEGRLQVDSAFQDPKFRLPSHFMAYAKDFCHAELIGGWTGFWPFPNWRASDGKLWNVSHILSLHPAMEMEIQSTHDYELVDAQPPLKLWRRTKPANWVEGEEPRMKVTIIEREPEVWEISVDSPQSSRVRLNRSSDPFSLARLKEKNLPLHMDIKSGQPLIEVPAGKETILYEFQFSKLP